MTLTPSTLTDIERKAKAAQVARSPGPDGDLSSDAAGDALAAFEEALHPSTVLAMVERIRELESLAAERYEDAEAAHARLGEPYQPGAVANALRDRIRQLEAALVEALGMLDSAGWQDEDRRASLRAIAGAGK